MTTATTIQRRKLGRSGPEVFPIALGCMGMSGVYGPADESESLATIHAAIDAGVNLLDTGDYYGMGHNEMLLGPGTALLPRKSPDFSQIRRTARPRRLLARVRRPPCRHIKACPCLFPSKRLGVDSIDIYRPAPGSIPTSPLKKPSARSPT